MCAMRGTKLAVLVLTMTYFKTVKLVLTIWLEIVQENNPSNKILVGDLVINNYANLSNLLTSLGVNAHHVVNLSQKSTSMKIHATETYLELLAATVCAGKKKYLSQYNYTMNP